MRRARRSTAVSPCARARGYKHHALRALGRLATLDGEVVTPLDRDLTQVFFREHPDADATLDATEPRPVARDGVDERGKERPLAVVSARSRDDGRATLWRRSRRRRRPARRRVGNIHTGDF